MPEQPEQNDFLKLFVKHNRRLFAYVLTMIPNHMDAEDVLQETAGILWSKFAEYETGSNFYAWARQIARYKVLEYYKRKKAVLVEVELLDRIQAASEPILDSIDERMAALRGCLKKLKPQDARLIHARFHENTTLKETAARTNQSVHTLYKRMAYIYTVLQVCIKKTLLTWE
jgi:RNA polymerase sigma-70 factor (ECF subfamily)